MLQVPQTRALPVRVSGLGESAHYVGLEDEEEMFLMAHVELKHVTRDEVWFLDSGCSNHMTGNKLWFISFDEGFRQSVKLENNSRMGVMGRGNIRMDVEGVTQIITQVYYIPELKNNLLSIGQLQEKGLAILIRDNLCKLFHPSRGLIMKSIMSANRMFVILASITPREHEHPPRENEHACFKTVVEEEAQLWHCRYGHLSDKGLKTLYYNKMVKGLPLIKAPTQICEGCVLGKQHRDPFPRQSQWRASKRLRLIHADIYEPITPASHGKRRY